MMRFSDKLRRSKDNVELPEWKLAGTFKIIWPPESSSPNPALFIVENVWNSIRILECECYSLVAEYSESTEK